MGLSSRPWLTSRRSARDRSLPICPDLSPADHAQHNSPQGILLAIAHADPQQILDASLKAHNSRTCIHPSSPLSAFTSSRSSSPRTRSPAFKRTRFSSTAVARLHPRAFTFYQ